MAQSVNQKRAAKHVMSEFLGGFGVSSAHFALAAVLCGGGVIAAALMSAFAPAMARNIGYTFLLRSAGVQVRTKAVEGSLDLSAVNDNDIEKTVRRRASWSVLASKRVFDVAAALALVILLAPLLVVVAIAIKLDSKGPVLYRQRRVGFKGEEFEIFKFRSMRTDAEKNGAKWAQENDDRITRVGRFIRKTRIDEIPQAINILRGEMSFVGPRPERPEFVRMLETEIPHYHARHLIKPGITGWAQVKHEYTASVEGARDKLTYDLFYIKHFSLLLDLLIVLMTVRVALLGIGSR